MNLSDYELPSVRDLFIPDPGHLICDVDLSGADAQVVAWESDDEDLKSAFRRGLKIHSHNAVTIDPTLGPYEAFEERRRARDESVLRLYDACKRGVHGTNYGASARTIAQTLNWSISRAEQFQSKWFRAHPKILDWHRRIERDLQTTRTIRNRFGNHRIYFDRVDTVFSEAIAWIPQSTVGLVTARADLALTAYFNRERNGEVLSQVHDSLIFQIHRDAAQTALEEVYRILHGIVVPYPDPLIIPWGLKISERSWGHCRDAKWSDYFKVTTSQTVPQSTRHIS